MKTLTLAAVAIALLAAPAYSQGRGRGASAPDQAADTAKKKVDDKAYNNALSNIPNATQAYDPWNGVREKSAESPKKKNGH